MIKRSEEIAHPCTLEPTLSGLSLAEIVQSCRDHLTAELREHGAILLRGFAVSSVEDFGHAIAALPYERMDYVYGSTPRTRIGERIFTATEYPAAHEIPLHNECAYQREWPLIVAFCCLQPAQVGGETPIADMRTITSRIGLEYMERFAKLGVRYIRHYHPFTDIAWQDVFKTASRKELAAICAARSIEHEWLDDDVLRTVQHCQGTAVHPCTGEHVFFNQAHLFHVSSVGKEGARALQDVFGIDRLPRHSCFGDGTQIPDEVLATVRAAFAAEARSVVWQAGDVLLLDNMRFAHGRRPFEGPRRLLAALLSAFSPTWS